jgi:hypothetical protein
MREKLVPQRVLLFLIAVAVVLLISGLVTLGLGELLAALEDELGSRVVKYVALGCAALCVVDLICLVLAQGLNSLAQNDEPVDEGEKE